MPECRAPFGALHSGISRYLFVRVPLDIPTIEKTRKHMLAGLLVGAQWSSNPPVSRSQSGALTDYAMGTTSMRPKGLEPPAHCLEGSCSIHLSYGRTLLSHWVLIWFAAVSRSTLREV